MAPLIKFWSHLSLFRKRMRGGGKEKQEEEEEGLSSGGDGGRGGRVSKNGTTQSSMVMDGLGRKIGGNSGLGRGRRKMR